MESINTEQITYNTKIIKTGKFTEIYLYHNKNFTRKEKKQSDDLKRMLDKWVDETLIEEAIEKSKDIELTEKQIQALEKLKKTSVERTDTSIQKSKKDLRRLINANLSQYKELDKLLTLTYGCDMKDRDKAFKDLKTFILNLRRAYKEDIQYVAVMEIQDGSRLEDKSQATNNIHWHLLMFNCPYIDQAILQKRWGKGIVDIRKLQKLKDVSGYLVNYLGDDELLKQRGKKSFTSSKNLVRPKEILSNNPLSVGELINTPGNEIVFTDTYQNQYAGKFTYLKIKNYEIEKLERKKIKKNK